jgi:quinolinate synthase
MKTTGAIDPRLDLAAEIKRLRQELNAVILAHYYQADEIQDLADHVGDSLALAQQAAKTRADVIVFCGVHFMAETAKILNPEKQVLLPDLKAGCSLSDSCPADKLAAWLGRFERPFVISYVNSSAAVKAMSDVICTSSNAVRIAEHAPKDRPIVFGPDRNLGRYVMQQTGREMNVWPGSCQVHEVFSEKKIVQLKVRHPDAEVVAHPECEDRVLAHADYIGSTKGMLDYVVKSPKRSFIVATEPGVIHQMRKAAPEKEYIPAPTDAGCACSECPHMRLNTLEKLYLCMRDRRPEITVPDDIRQRALVPLKRMLDWS